jgi:Holliday junction resolvasome RuvABC endonuclease subunit
VIYHVGVDYSLTSPAVCVSVDGTWENSQLYYLNSKKKTEGKVAKNITGTLHQVYSCDQQRYQNNMKWVFGLIEQYPKKSVKVMIEDYSFGSKGRVFNLAENCGVLKQELWRQGYSYSAVPPTVLKKFASGKGNANKEKMYEAFLQKYSVDLILEFGFVKLDNPITDIVDAFFLSQYSMETK